MSEHNKKSKQSELNIEPQPIAILVTLITTLGTGTVFYHTYEGLGWIDSLYFSVITLTTVGYGDFSPTTDGGKIFTIFYVLFGIGIVAFSANYLLKNAAKRNRRS